MLRINLLPAYIAERRKTRAAIAISVIVFLLPVIALLAYWVQLQGQVKDEEAKATDVEQKKSQIDAINTKAQQTLSQIAPLKDKVDFVENVHFYNTLAPRIYRQAARYTIREVEYNKLAIQGSTLSVAGFVSGGPENTGAAAVRNFGRYLITFFGNPDITALSVAGLPGYPSPSTGTGTAANGAAGGAPGFPGAYPGAGNPYAGRGGPGMGGPGMAGIETPGGPGLAGGQTNEVGPNGEQLPPRPGFPFSATATLKHPVTPPTLPASLGGGTTGANGVPGMPGEMGMPPGGGPEGTPPTPGPAASGG